MTAEHEKREEVVGDLLERFEKIYEKIQHRQRNKVETVEELEQQATRRYRDQQEQWANDLEDLRRRVEEEQVAASAEQTKKELLAREVSSSQASLRQIELVNEEFETSVDQLARDLQAKQAEVAAEDAATQQAREDGRELEEKLEGLRQQLDGLKGQTEQQALAVAEETTVVALLRQQIKDKAAAQARKTEELDRELSELRAREEQLRQEMKASYEKKLEDIVAQCQLARRAQLDELDDIMGREFDSQLAVQQSRYESLQRELEDLQGNDKSMSNAIAVAKKALSDAKKKASSVDALKAKLDNLQLVRKAELDSRQGMREQLDQQLKEYADLLAQEAQRAQQLQDYTRLLDAEIERLKGLVEAGEALLGLHKPEQREEEPTAPAESQASPPPTARATKRRRTAKKTKEPRQEPGPSGVADRDEGVAPRQLDFDDSVLVPPVADVVLVTQPAVEGDIHIVEVGEKGDYVVLQNKTDTLIDISGWALVSAKAGTLEHLQEHTFDAVQIFSGEELAISLGQDAAGTERYPNRETIGWGALPLEHTLLSLYGIGDDKGSRLVSQVNITTGAPDTTEMDVDRTVTGQNANCAIM